MAGEQGSKERLTGTTNMRVCWGVVDQLASKESGEIQGVHGWFKTCSIVLGRVGGIISINNA